MPSDPAISISATAISAKEWAARIRRGELSARASVEACLARIEQVEPQLNAVVRLRATAARREADEADRRQARGQPLGPLHGVPMTLKDSLDTHDLVSTWGTPGRADYLPERDATVARRLRAAGAILLGKTNTPELTMSFETDNALYGRTRNPYDVERSPGGSSGGAAAIVAAAGAGFDVGSDTGGSIRVPCHFCGVAGLKPGPGRVPRSGHAIGPDGPIEWLTQLGPIARRVEDLDLLLRVIAGPDGRDPSLAPVPLGDPAAVKLEALRVAWYVDNGIRAAEPALAECVEAVARGLERAGVRIRRARPPGIEDTLVCYSSLLAHDGGAGLRRILTSAGTAVEQSSLGYLARRKAPEADVQAAIFARVGHYRRDLLHFLEDFDAVLCPPNAGVAPLPHTSDAHYADYAYTMAFNLAGWPAAVVRAGTAPGDLPVGVQIASAPWREDVALALAAEIERTHGGWRAPSL